MAQLVSNLPIEARVKFGKYSVNGENAQDIKWLIVAKDHSGYPSNSITLLTEKLIDLRCFDAAESRSSGSDASWGNNKYSVSNIDQWLNKDEGDSWYVAAHNVDQKPSNGYTDGNTPYDTRPGFLNAFSYLEKAAILNTSVLSASLVTTSGDVNTSAILRKVFLPSLNELGKGSQGYDEGEVWDHFSSANQVMLQCGITEQCHSYTTSTNKIAPENNSRWFTRTPNESYSRVSTITAEGNVGLALAYTGDIGIRPALNILSSVKVSDTTDSEGCYVCLFNSAPPVPATLNVPTIYGGKPNSISWSPVTDPDGDGVTYQLECAYDGSSTYEQIYSGASSTYAHFVPFGTISVTYRVRATDPSGESSAYTTSATITVVNNNAPLISGADANLGVMSSGFTGTYTITDANNNAVTVTEAIDGVQIRSLVATLGQAITYGVTENTWLALPNGSHTLTISATDGIDTAVRTYTFTKLVDTLRIQNATPWVSSAMPSRIMLVITRNIPSAATFKVEVCNNGYDASPTWEDATDAVKSGLVHVFENTVKTATSWGVLVKVTVARNGATGACYISAIGGNFE